MNDIILKPGKERSLLRRHPWVFSGAIAKTPQELKDGETVRVLDSQKNFLAYASFSGKSSIALRVWSFLEKENIDLSFFQKKIAAAYDLRKQIFHGTLPDAYRLLFAEADGLPGVIADIYPGFAVLQLSTAGADHFRREITECLGAIVPNVYERSDVDGRKREGLESVTGVLQGEEPPEFLTIDETEIKFKVSVRNGHKTGFYIDQRENRAMVRAETSAGAEVLNCFSYTGGFGLAALAGGAASVLNLDSSAPALQLAQENAALNCFTAEQFQTECADVFQYLRKCRDAARQFDMIILDPPKLAETMAQRDKAARAYKDLNLLALKLLRPGGKLFTFSCSGAMDDDLFGKVVAAAALDARADFRIIRHLMQGPDHPVATSFPEGRYLKGFYGIKAN